MLSETRYAISRGPVYSGGMDTLFHGVLGAAACSNVGLPGALSKRGCDRRWFAEWTLWAAFFFGVFPDIASLGIHFATNFFAGNGVRWTGIPDFVFFLYRVTHSLLGIALGYSLLVLWKRALWLPALAWPLHVAVDLPTHGDGVFRTPIFWPFSSAGFVGWSWWQHPRLFYSAWVFAIGLWSVSAIFRAARVRRCSSASGSRAE
ncbi:MAG: hypothetical protein M9935_00990 [Kiritimatiellae bacterium]|nr:hypothetical protein [Kiritimatiellia bacterium]